MGLLDLIRRNTFEHGVHPPEHKEETCHLPVRRMPFAPRMIIPLSQHFGKPAVPLVHRGQEVVRGEPIARADGFMSVPMHAPATGIIEGIELIPTARGPKTESIVLKAYPGATQRVLYGESRAMDQLTPEQIIQAVQDSGMVGLGGAAFPTHVKLRAPKEQNIDTLVVNGCECEPYLTTDHRVMIEYTDELLAGVRIAMRATGAKRAAIGVEDNKRDAIEAIERKLPADGSISVHGVKTKYPQGSEKLLIKVLLRREVPSGGYPYQVGAVVSNVGTLAQLGMLLPQGQGLIERVVTFAGSGIKRPGNYIVPLGTPIGFALDYVGCEADAGQIIIGGPMMGSSIGSLDVPIMKGVSGVVVLSKAETEQAAKKTYPCIRCGRCLDVCPVKLNPSQMGRLAVKRQYETMQEKYHLNDCFECGSCAYVCPSNIPLVQYFRISKAINHENRERAA